MVMCAYQNLAAKRELVDALNVFPVPDGDTGTNMWLTLQAVVDGINKNGDDLSLDELLPSIARYSLLGARGNSGVILSQFFGGFAQSLEGKKTARTRELAQAMKIGFEKAYQTVAKPMEGTILTVMREVSVEANRFYHEDLVRWGRKILDRAKSAERKTREMLPVLKRAGVTDAGGRGFVYVLEAFIAAIENKKIIPIARKIKKMAQQTKVEIARKIKEIPQYRYCFEFFINGIKVKIETIKLKLLALGDSLLIAKIKNLVHIHIHTNQPETVTVVARTFGEVSQIKLDEIGVTPKDRITRHEFGVLTVVSGTGLKKIFKNLGADMVVTSRRATSIKELLAAIEEMDARTVVLLPNDGNAILAANQVSRLSRKPVVVIPTRTIPEGINSLLAFNLDESLQNNIQAMTESIRGVKSGLVSIAIRPSTGETLTVKKCDCIGISADRMIAKAKNPESCLIKLVRALITPESQLITVFYGAGVKKQTAGRVAQMLTRTFPGVEVQFYHGGQPIYHFLVGVA